MIYVFGTSAFIVLFRDGNYDREIFPTLWKNFDELVREMKIISVRETRREIEKGDDDLFAWSKKNAELFHAPDENQTQFIQGLLAKPHWRGLVKRRNIVSGNPVADPFVIALAYHIKGGVVTQEKRKPNAPSIPNVCEEYSIDCMNLAGFMKKERWQF